MMRQLPAFMQKAQGPSKMPAVMPKAQTTAVRMPAQRPIIAPRSTSLISHFMAPQTLLSEAMDGVSMGNKRYFHKPQRGQENNYSKFSMFPAQLLRMLRFRHGYIPQDKLSSINQGGYMDGNNNNT